MCEVANDDNFGINVLEAASRSAAQAKVHKFTCVHRLSILYSYFMNHTCA